MTRHRATFVGLTRRRLTEKHHFQILIQISCLAAGIAQAQGPSDALELQQPIQQEANAIPLAGVVRISQRNEISTTPNRVGPGKALKRCARLLDDQGVYLGACDALKRASASRAAWRQAFSVATQKQFAKLVTQHSHLHLPPSAEQSDSDDMIRDWIRSFHLIERRSITFDVSRLSFDEADQIWDDCQNFSADDLIVLGEEIGCEIHNTPVPTATDTVTAAVVDPRAPPNEAQTQPPPSSFTSCPASSATVVAVRVKPLKSICGELIAPFMISSYRDKAKSNASEGHSAAPTPAASPTGGNVLSTVLSLTADLQDAFDAIEVAKEQIRKRDSEIRTLRRQVLRLEKGSPTPQTPQPEKK